MKVCSHKRIVLLLVAITLGLGTLLVSGGPAARAGGNDTGLVAPTGVAAVANSPGIVTLQWFYTGDVATLDSGAAFTVFNDSATPPTATPVQNATGTSIGNLQPNQQYKFRVCANYDPGQACAADVTVTTQAVPAAGTSSILLPIIYGNDQGFGNDGNPWIGLYWETNGDSHDYYEIYYEVKPASGNWQDPGTPVRAPNGASQSYHQVSDLLPGTTYLFKVKACDRIIFGIGGTQCGALSSAYQAATPQFANASNRPTPTVFSGGSTTNSISISWSISPHYSYDHYVIQYSPQAAAGAAPATPTTAQVTGDQSNYTTPTITPGTYVFTVQGCDLLLFPTPVVDCATASAPYTTSTSAPLNTGGGGTIIGNLKAVITVTPPTINPGNTVTIAGSSFPVSDGPVTVGYSWSATSPSGGEAGGAGTGRPVTTVSAQGTFTATLTIPSDVLPSTVTVSAQSNTASATAPVQVVAPSAKGTLTLVYTPNGSAAVPDFAPDTDGFVLSGINFAPGQVTIFMDSPQGPQLMTATVGADGTFSQAFEPSSAQTGGKTGQHTLVAVQNGNVAGQLSVTIDPPLHVG